MAKHRKRDARSSGATYQATPILFEAQFLRLCEGLHPQTGERLTQRMNTNRQNADGETAANCGVFYDFTISPPKSV